MQSNIPRETSDPNKKSPGYDVEPDVTPRRIGGDDSLAESSPTDNMRDTIMGIHFERLSSVLSELPSTTFPSAFFISSSKTTFPITSLEICMESIIVKPPCCSVPMVRVKRAIEA